MLRACSKVKVTLPRGPRAAAPEVLPEVPPVCEVEAVEFEADRRPLGAPAVETEGTAEGGATAGDCDVVL